MRAHEAGWAHAESGRGPSWLREPSDINALVPLLWSGTARKNDAGALEVGGVDLRALVAEHGSPSYVLDEHDFRARARAFREGFAGYDVYYAGKAFLCTSVARWVAELVDSYAAMVAGGADADVEVEVLSGVVSSLLAPR